MTLYTTPVIYLYMDRFGAWLRGDKKEPKRYPVLVEPPEAEAPRTAAE